MVATADLLPFQAATDTTHKYFGIQEAVSRHRDAQAFCVISSGNRYADLKRYLKEERLKIPVYALVSQPRGWENEVIMEENRILRNGAERARYVSERAGIPASGIVDLTDARSKTITRGLRELIKERKYNKVFLPVGSGGLALDTIAAAESAGKIAGLDVTIGGFTPGGENGIFIDPARDYALRESKLYYKRFAPQSIADKLSCPYTTYRSALLKACERGHRIIEVDDEQFKAAYAMAHMTFLTIEPSSCAGMIGLTPFAWERGLIADNDHALVLITGTAQKSADEGKSTDQMAHICCTPQGFSYYFVSNFGDQDRYEGAWCGSKLDCTLFTSRMAPQQFSVDLQSLIAESEENPPYDLLRQKDVAAGR
jgi:hypothetical protein